MDWMQREDTRRQQGSRDLEGSQGQEDKNHTSKMQYQADNVVTGRRVAPDFMLDPKA